MTILVYYIAKDGELFYEKGVINHNRWNDSK